MEPAVAMGRLPPRGYTDLFRMHLSPELSNEMQNLRGGKEIVFFYQKESCVKGGKTTNTTHTKGRLHKKICATFPKTKMFRQFDSFVTC